MSASAAARNFHQEWYVGRPVQENAPPHRKGTIKAVQGTGGNARIIVNLAGHPPVTFHPAQLTPL